MGQDRDEALVTTLTAAQVYALARGAGLSPSAATIATAVAASESGFRTDAQGDIGLQDATWGPSVGLWQIRSLKSQYGTGGPRDASQLTDPTFNARSMATISAGGANFKPWSTFTSGAYLKNMSASGASEATPATGGAPAAGTATPASWNPLSGIASGWSGQAQVLGLKLAGVALGIGLLLMGANRVVMPALAGQITKNLGGS